MKYRLRDSTVQAIQFTEEVAANGWADGVPQWLDTLYDEGRLSNETFDAATPSIDRIAIMLTEGGTQRIGRGAWIVYTQMDRLLGITAEVFAAAYEPVEEP